jgi:o-succinylbenzoate synthase
VSVEAGVPVEVEPFAVDLVDPLRTARGTLAEREGLLVRARLDGAWGVGEATPLPGWTESLPECRAALDAARERLAGVDPARGADDGPDGRHGAWAVLPDPDDHPAARHGLALALADAAARAAGEPLAARLRSRWRGRLDGGAAGRPDDDERVPDAVRANATVGDDGADATVAAAREAVAAGFDCLKLKAGARPLEADLDRVRAVRAALDPDVALRVDANGAWEPGAAARAVRALDGVVAYVEQPLGGGDVPGHAALRGRGAPVALDESLVAAGADELLRAGAADVLVVKPTALGGVDRALDVAARARARDVDVVVTTTVDAAVARAGATHLAAAVPDVPACGLATGSLLASDLAPVPVASAGRVAVPPGAGLGDAFDDRRSGDG